MTITHMHASASLSRATPLCGGGTDRDLVVDEPERTNCLACRVLVLAQEWDVRARREAGVREDYIEFVDPHAQELRDLLDSLADVPVPVQTPRKDDPAYGGTDAGMRRLVEMDQYEPHPTEGRVPRGVCRCPILTVGDFCPVHGG